MPKGGGNGPSWVPDWSKELPREPMTFGRFASGQSCAGGARIIDDSIIEVVGVKCGVVSWIEDLTQRKGHGTWDYWRRVSKAVMRFDEKFDDSSDPQLDDSVATLCGNRVREMYPWFRRLVDSRRYGRSGSKNSKIKLTDTGDVIAVLLGFDAPVVLRPKAGGYHVVVGEAYVHGLMSGEAILGPLPPGWQAQADRSQQGIMYQKFTKGSDGAVLDDPRLGPLSAEFGWHDQTALPEHDPRLLPEALKYRGLNMQTFQLC